MSELAAILQEAKALVSDPQKWIQGYDATDANGEECDSYDTEATCFCAGGAIIRAAGQRGDYITALRLFRKVTIGDDKSGCVFPWNDDGGRTHSEVMAAFDRAIELASA